MAESEAAATLRNDETANGAVNVVLLGPELRRPLSLARQVHGALPVTQTVFLARPDQSSRLRHDMASAPLVGTYWTIVELGDSPLLSTVEEAVRSTRQRRQLQRTISRINTRLSARLEIDAEQYDRLLVSDRFLASVLDHAQEAILSVRPDGRILTCNQAAAELFGFYDEGIPGQPIERLFDASQAEDVREMVRAAQCDGCASRRELLCQLSGGATIDVEVTFAPVTDDREKPIAVSVIARDISERKRSEEQLRSLNEQLEQRVAERTAVAERRASQLRRLAAELTQTEQRERRRLAQLLHDHLQQLLVAARLAVDAAQKRERDAAVREMLENVDHLIRESIATSRTLTADLSPPVLYDAGLAAALQWLARSMQQKHGLEVEVVADINVEDCEQAVRVTLFEAVRELLFNIVKHAGVGAARVEVHQEEANLVRIEVSDRGAGFDLVAAREKYDLDAGIGLFSIAERLELLGGAIDIRSAPGEGTRITLTSPRRRAGSEADFTSPSSSGVTSEPRSVLAAERASDRVRVLLADDHKILRQGLAKILREHSDIEVVGEASDGEMAVELARELKPDVIVMDIGMPRLSGLEATRRILAETPRVRVIGLSFHERCDMAETMIKAGAAGYLTKGGPMEDLLASIREAAPAGRALSG